MLLRVNFPLDNRSYVVRVLGEVVMSASVLSQKSIDSKLHSHPCETGCVEQDEMKGDTYHISYFCECRHNRTRYIYRGVIHLDIFEKLEDS